MNHGGLPVTRWRCDGAERYRRGVRWWPRARSVVQARVFAAAQERKEKEGIAKMLNTREVRTRWRWCAHGGGGAHTVVVVRAATAMSARVFAKRTKKKRDFMKWVVFAKGCVLKGRYDDG